MSAARGLCGLLWLALAGGLAAQTSQTPAPPPRPTSIPAPMPAPRTSIVVQPNGARFDLTTSNAPAAQVFMQIGQGTPYSMLVAPDVAGQVTVALKDTTVLEAMESMRELYGYDFRVAGNRIFVQSNMVQTRIFKIHYLAGRRVGTSDLRVTSSSMAQSSDSSGSTGNASANSNSGSNSNSSTSGSSGARSDDNARVRTTSEADFWREVRESLLALIGTAEQRGVVLNPAAGVIVVRAAPAELRLVEAYLQAMQLSIVRQVMIEAKIVSVELSQSAQAGVNWGAFGNNSHRNVSFGAAAPGAVLAPRGALDPATGLPIALSDGINTITAGANLAASAVGGGFYGLAFQASNFAAMLNFLESQGDVQVLSSPRIATLNNQKAVLKVGSDEVFVTGVSATTTSNTVGSVSTPSLTFQAFFSGVALDVTPQIDDVGNVMLHVHPTVSQVTEQTKNLNLGSLGSFRLPLALSTVSETDSVVRVRNGQIVAIGGLMTVAQNDDRSGLPGISRVPVLGALFRQKSNSLSKRELVILIKPTVIGDEGPWPDPDGSLMPMPIPMTLPLAPVMAPAQR